MNINHWIDLNLKASTEIGLWRKKEKDHDMILQESYRRSERSYRREEERDILMTREAFSCREKVIDF